MASTYLIVRVTTNEVAVMTRNREHCLALAVVVPDDAKARFGIQTLDVASGWYVESFIVPSSIALERVREALVYAIDKAKEHAPGTVSIDYVFHRNGTYAGAWETAS